MKIVKYVKPIFSSIMKKIYYFVTLLISIAVVSCATQKKTYIVANEDVIEAANDLASYLSKTYLNEFFISSDNKVEGAKNIILEVVSSEELENDEAYKVFSDGGQLFIQGKTPRAIVNGVYGLLKELGWSFNLSFEIPPTEAITFDFSELKIENAPLKEKRIIFNWHNFLSGCTAWDFEQWKQWIDNSAKIGFNTVMVHVYGNNPMQSFSLNGKEKELGYLTTSLKGRDWGAQHVNDVRLMQGGEIFADYEFGSQAAKVPEGERSIVATSLMKKVFKHAAKKSMDVCYAFDVDTWMANPQNIINTVTGEALLEIGGYNIVNPEHPEGKKYYKAQLKKLLSDYPEITMVAAWMRRPQKIPGKMSIWLMYGSLLLPKKWKEEYFEILKQYPELIDEPPYPGLFAISKIIRIYHEILNETRPDIELVLGSWFLDFPKQANPFMPDYCGFMPLDYECVFDKPEVLEELSEVGKTRNLYPLVCAQHDDHRYIGRPYKPQKQFNASLNKANANGYAVIHWMTHPFDLYFNNTENQVWKNSEDETLEKASTDFALSLMKSDDEHLVTYFDDWFSNAPMFGRETTDYFMPADEDYHLEGYNSALEVIERAEIRLKILEKVNPNALNEQGLKEYNYQVGMENFIISFFNNHHNIHKATLLLQVGKREEAMQFVQRLKPKESIKLYAETIAEFGATKGEEGTLLSLNLRWLPDYIDLRQRVGLEPIRINFQPTSHDPLAQGAGNNTFFIDKEKNFWSALGEKELNVKATTNRSLPLKKVTDSWIEISEETIIPIKTIRNFKLPASDFKISLIPAAESANCNIELRDDDKVISSVLLDDFSGAFVSSVKLNGNLSVKIKPVNGIVRLAGLIIEEK